MLFQQSDCFIYHMVGNFCERFISRFYELTAIRENYDHEQLKRKNHISICPTWNYLATNRSMSVSVPLMAIAEAILEI